VTTEPVTPEAAAPDPTRTVRATFKGLGAVVAPTSAVTGLLYYFGWTRSSFEARRLGLDDSLLGYSTQDYLLRSMSSMLAPLAVGLLVVLVAVAFHALVTARARRAGTAGQPLARLSIGAAGVGAVALVAGFVGTRVSDSTRAVYLVAPLAVTAGLVLLVYAAALYRQAFAARHAGATWGFPRAYNGLVVGAVVMLLMVSLFADVGRYAVVKGYKLADQVEALVPRQPGVVLYSEKRLYLQAPVVETRLDPENAAYNYAYSGLKFLFRADGKFFLRPEDTRARVNIIVPDGLDIRLELYPAAPPRS
jgi:hypothetical protein